MSTVLDHRIARLQAVQREAERLKREEERDRPRREQLSKAAIEALAAALKAVSPSA